MIHRIFICLNVEKQSTYKCYLTTLYVICWSLIAHRDEQHAFESVNGNLPAIICTFKWLKISKSRKENPQKLTQLSSRSHPKHLVGKRTAQKDTIIDITSDSQMNSNFPYRWSPASLIFNNYFYLFLYLYIT